MSFFDHIFSPKSVELPAFWKVLESDEDLDMAIELSAQKPAVLFKHSTRCIISKTVLRNFEKEIAAAEDLPFDLYYLDLLNHRNISNKIAEDLSITHQSPQVVLVKDKKAVYHTSHDQISLKTIIEKI